MSTYISHALTHLRFSFSIFLLPVFLFALSGVREIDWSGAAIAFVVLHLLIYPASNGYNSLMDRDTGSIGGIKNPPKAPPLLFPLSLFMDVLGLLLTLAWNPYAALVLLLYILASRAYSWRKIRLKRLPWIGFITVVVFQGAVVYFYTVIMSDSLSLAITHLPLEIQAGMWISSLMIAASYPLTQVYQHQQDAEDGVTTLSMYLGKVGTFNFSIILFIIFTAMLFAYIGIFGRLYDLLIYLVLTTPSAVHLFSWYRKVVLDPSRANFENSMRMSFLGAAGLNLFFLYMLLAVQIF